MRSGGEMESRGNGEWREMRSREMRSGGEMGSRGDGECTRGDVRGVTVSSHPFCRH